MVSSLPTDQVKTDLSHRFERFKTNDATLASLKEIHSARERSLSTLGDRDDLIERIDEAQRAESHGS